MSNAERLKTTERFIAWLLVDSASRRRLRGAIAVFKVNLESRRKATPTAVWIPAATTSVSGAETALGNYDLDTGWASLHAAERHEISGLDPVELFARRDEVLREAMSKLTDWRRESVVTILGPVDAKGSKIEPGRKETDAPTEQGTNDVASLRMKLKEALRVRDEHFYNVYRKTEVRRNLLFVTAVILTAALFVVYSMAYGGTWTHLGDADTLLSVIVFGFLGGLVSIAVSLANDANAGKRMPEHIASTYVTLARPIFGAAFAVAVYLAMSSGVITVFDGKPSAVALAAFLAGFSERWFLGVVSGIESRKSS